MPMVQPMAQSPVEPQPDNLNTPIGQPTGQPPMGEEIPPVAM